MNIILIIILALVIVYFTISIYEHVRKEKNKSDEASTYELYKIYFKKHDDMYMEILGAMSEESAEDIFYRSMDTTEVVLVKIEPMNSRDSGEEQLYENSESCN